MAYWVALTILCCTVGFWVATKNNLNGTAGISLGLSFSILFSTGLYAEFRRYDPSLKAMLVVFVVLLCVTFLLLLERHTLVAWLKLASLTFIVSVLAHEIIPNPAYLMRAQSALNYISEASGVEALDLRAIIISAESRANALAKNISKGSNTLIEVRRETELLSIDGYVSQRIGAGTWAVLSGDTLENPEQRLAEVEILDEEGQVTQVGYLDESDIGLKVIIPPDEHN